MMEFDYAKAWRELAVPAWPDLPVGLRLLAQEVADKCRHLRQGHDLQMLWPHPSMDELDWRLADRSPLYGQLQEYPAEALAAAAHVVDALGHWKPSSGAGLVPPDLLTFLANDHGAHWKFSNYVDQVLRDRCGLLRHGKETAVWPAKPDTWCAGYDVRDGFLMVRFFSNARDGGWSNHTVGLGTPQTLELATRIVAPGTLLRYATTEKLIPALKALRPGPETVIGKFFDMTPFMYDGEARKKEIANGHRKVSSAVMGKVFARLGAKYACLHLSDHEDRPFLHLNASVSEEQAYAILKAAADCGVIDPIDVELAAQ